MTSKHPARHESLLVADLLSLTPHYKTDLVSCLIGGRDKQTYCLGIFLVKWHLAAISTNSNLSHSWKLVKYLLGLTGYFRNITIKEGVFSPHFSSCWVTFGRLCFALVRFWPDVPRHWRFPPASGGHLPRLLSPSGGGAWGAPNKGNADGAEGIFGNAGCVLALALQPDPP